MKLRYKILSGVALVLVLGILEVTGRAERALGGALGGQRIAAGRVGKEAA